MLHAGGPGSVLTGLGTKGRLIDAVKHGDVERVRQLLERQCFDVNHEEGKSASAPLHWAADKGHTETAALLLDAGADVKQLDADGRTALHWAAIAGNAKTAALLVEKGADVNQVDKLYNWTPIHQAAYRGHTKTIAMLVDHYAAVNQADVNGNTPLHLAATAGQSEAVALLLENSAYIDQGDSRGVTSLFHAVDNYRRETVVLLLQKRAQLSQSSSCRNPTVFFPEVRQTSWDLMQAQAEVDPTLWRAQVEINVIINNEHKFSCNFEFGPEALGRHVRDKLQNYLDQKATERHVVQLLFQAGKDDLFADDEIVISQGFLVTLDARVQV
eukprot:TRINITY_DN75433_c0_g1_i1.p1 TRINITY_DN75433_c0_g1~~TRINITY_DN75433_c0_g1_i1.p1  ORF type:complete len:366 (-),score=76.90 TRINITY_DN75433_c0_g1_i1:84-1067(-)